MGQVIGIILLFVGIILFIGNVSGWWPTFSYAGFITMAFGTLVIRNANDD